MDGVTAPVEEGGLGFTHKWNMGWMHDTLQYLGRDPVHRQHHHSEISFGLVYAFSERFVLPLSHDEVVHGKGALLAKMTGEPAQRLAQLRAYYGFMWAHPGSKLLFMGGEFGQGHEWSHDAALDWAQAASSEGQGLSRLVRDSTACSAPNPRCIATSVTSGVSTGAWPTTAATAFTRSSAGIRPAAAAPCWW